MIDVEEFLASLIEIDRLVPRLQCMKFKHGFDNLVQKLESDIKAATVACEEVVKSRKFHQILHLILSVGNFMNSGSLLGRAAGFELPVLAKLNDLKSTDNKQTLLHSLVEILAERRPDLLKFGDELVHLHEAVHVSTDDVDETIKEIDGMLEFIREEITITKESDPTPDDTFVDVMSSFTSKCHDKLKVLMEMNKCMQIRCIEVADFFVFNLKNYRIAECFKDIATFKGLFAEKLIKIAKSRKSGNMKVQTRSLYKHSTVKVRDFRIKLHRLSTKGLYL